MRAPGKRPRLGLALRVLAGTAGAYGLAALANAALARWLPGGPLEATLWSTLLALLVAVAVLLLVFLLHPRVGGGSVRQAMAWLHGWLGLLTGWLLFAICLTGTASYYRDEISQWMRPELPRVVAVDTVAQAAAAERAFARLRQQSPDAASWFVSLPDARNPVMQVSALPRSEAGSAEPRGPQLRSRRYGETLDPHTGQPLQAGPDGAAPAPARATRGGDFFYVFHFTLNYLPPRTARWIVGVVTLFMLATLISGVITHKRILADFFTFRPRKGQRSWLDAHNVMGVLALPFHLMITYTGLVTLMFLLFPWGIQSAYGDSAEDRNRFFGQALPQSPAQVARAGTPAPMRPIGDLVAQARAHWGGAPVGRISVNQPGDANAVVVLTRGDAGHAQHNRQRLSYGAVSGQLLRVEGEDHGAASATRSVLYALHLGRFADAGLRALFFLSGLACAAMVATGALLWAAKRRAGARGRRFVQGLNIGAIAGPLLAIPAFFWANRLLPTGLAGRAAWEEHVFFIAWGLATLAGLAWATRGMWRAQLGLAALAFALLPLGTWLATAAPLSGFDAVMVATGLALAGMAWRVGRAATGAQPGAARRPPAVPREARA